MTAQVQTSQEVGLAMGLKREQTQPKEIMYLPVGNQEAPERRTLETMRTIAMTFKLLGEREMGAPLSPPQGELAPKDLDTELTVQLLRRHTGLLAATASREGRFPGLRPLA